ncbi:metal ABC transporter permease [Aestuariibius insulae]|uniref:metal ABC transporter permease n=1 Tax=Aestuariibius insulae TaxID=2058287 RepID=UPI00345EC466
MLDDFLIRAFLAGIGTALVAAPLGCFVVWRRMAYFSDATAHSAMLGIAIAVALQVSPAWGALLTALAIAMALTVFSGRTIASDTVLGVFAHGALAAGIIATTLLPGRRIDLEALLFGDILTVSRFDLALIWIGAALVLPFFVWRWNALLTATLDPDLARASGLRPEREQMGLTFALAVVIAISIEVIGVLLIGALLVIPAAAARPLVKTPEQMVLGAFAIGLVSIVGGLQIAAIQNFPAGPTIVCTALICFILTALMARLSQK